MSTDTVDCGDEVAKWLNSYFQQEEDVNAFLPTFSIMCVFRDTALSIVHQRSIGTVIVLLIAIRLLSELIPFLPSRVHRK